MLKIYGVPLSPFVRKVHLALAHKGVDFEMVATMPGDESPEFRALSPLGKVPAMQHDDFSVADSSIILRYIDVEFPDKSIYSADSRTNATLCWLEEFADTKLVEGCSVFFRERLLNPTMFNQPTDEALVAETETNVMPGLLSYLESVVDDSGYFLGDSLSVADLAIVSAFCSAQYGSYQVDAASYPKLAAYLARALSADLVTAQLAKEQVVMQSLVG